MLYLVAKGLPTLPCKQVEKVWGLEFVDMEDFLPAPRSLRLAEQGTAAPSFQESLVGALNQFQAIQWQKKSNRRVTDAATWVKCFTLYIAVMAKKKGGNGAEYGVPPAYGAKTFRKLQGMRRG